MQSNLIGSVLGAIVLSILGLYFFGTWGGVLGLLFGLIIGQRLHGAW